MTDEKDCYLCRQGFYLSDYQPTHGFMLPGVGFVDVKCPTTQDEYDKLVVQLTKEIQK